LGRQGITLFVLCPKAWWKSHHTQRWPSTRSNFLRNSSRLVAFSSARISFRETVKGGKLGISSCERWMISEVYRRLKCQEDEELSSRVLQSRWTSLIIIKGRCRSFSCLFLLMTCSTFMWDVALFFYTTQLDKKMTKDTTNTSHLGQSSQHTRQDSTKSQKSLNRR